VIWLFNRKVIIGLSLVLISLIGLIGVSMYSPRTITLEFALQQAEKYLASLNDSDLVISEIMEFEHNFYVVYTEQSTHMGAFEMLIDKTTGRIFPEYGPNMMWNTKYGHGGMMGHQAPSGEIQIDETEAVHLAQEFLNTIYPGTVADDLHPFYGYYTLHTKQNGEIFGMLSVNSYTGEVWYHNWHGAFIQQVDLNNHQ
jgi:hypothetical protein